MKPRAIRPSGLGVGFLLFLAAPAGAQYENGYHWSRHSEWIPGTSQGSAVNNPGPDATGSAVWSYEVAHVGGLGSEDPWYASATELLTWDEAWWQSERGAWSRGDEVNPPVFDDFITHNLGPRNIDSVPLVRWSNPAGDGAVLNMEGMLRLLWTGEDFVGAPTDVDVIVGLFDASTQAITLLLETTVGKPHDGLSAGDWAEVPVALQAIEMDSGDSFVISARGHDVLPGHWIDLHDTDVAITLVPGPGATGLLAGAGLGCLRGRRR